MEQEQMDDFVAEELPDGRVVISSVPSIDKGYLVVCLDPEERKFDVVAGPVGEISPDSLDNLGNALTLGDALRLIAERVDQDMGEA
jgi:hypothetical protein